MNTNMKSKINAARQLYQEIGRISELGSQRSGRASASVDGQMDGQNGKMLLQGGALPVSAPNSLASKLLKVTVADAAAQDDLCEFPRYMYSDPADDHAANRLYETKSSLLDLCSRQLNDLLDEAPSDQKDIARDIDELLSEMQVVRRSMETMVAIERALHDS